MKKLLFSLLLFSGIAYGQYPSVLVDLRNDPDATELQINDLQQQQVNLGFDFPLYDQTFSDVWVTYTGVLNFQETANGGNFCCNGRDMDDPQFQQQAANGQYQHLNYSILAGKMQTESRTFFFKMGFYILIIEIITYVLLT